MIHMKIKYICYHGIDHSRQKLFSRLTNLICLRRKNTTGLSETSINFGNKFS